ncbi:MAG: hypothetical protein IJR04_00905 [Bacteroidales bacterium]|nr:hypothetical protein [Bacteroidales bacterium]
MRSLFLFFLIVPFLATGQTYYGNNGFCKLALLNDSVYRISAYSLVEEEYYDTGYYQIKHDTLFLSSVQPPCLTISTQIDTDDVLVENGSPYLIKGYRLINDKLCLQFEYTVNKVYTANGIKTFYCPYSIYEGDIVVVYDNWTYLRTYLKQKNLSKGQCLVGFFISITPDKNDRVYFDKFPLLKKDNMLLPLNENKNHESWIYNGFYVPILTTKEQEIHPRCLLYRGSFDF